MSAISELSKGPRVFIVEDEATIAMLLEDMLAEEGCEVVASAYTLRQAQAELALNPKFDLAILDVNVAGQPVFGLADVLKDQGIALIFATGYGEAGLPDAWRGSVVLQKPMSQHELKAALARAMEHRPAPAAA